MYVTHGLAWDGNRLRLGRKGRLLATVERDLHWNGMWRVRTPDGGRSDMTNYTRARDAAISLAMQALNQPMRQAA
jgi:hypothetical protein